MDTEKHKTANRLRQDSIRSTKSKESKFSVRGSGKMSLVYPGAAGEIWIPDKWRPPRFYFPLLFVLDFIVKASGTETFSKIEDTFAEM